MVNDTKDIGIFIIDGIVQQGISIVIQSVCKVGGNMSHHIGFTYVFIAIQMCFGNDTCNAFLKFGLNHGNDGIRESHAKANDNFLEATLHDEIHGLVIYRLVVVIVAVVGLSSISSAFVVVVVVNIVETGR